MGEIARRRTGRDVWISRGHLWAGGAGIGIAMLLAFLLGVAVGRRGTGEDGGGREDRVVGGDLVDLLARIEASSSSSGAERLTYPEALAGRTVEVGIPEAPPLPGRASVGAAPLATLPSLGPPPREGVGIRVARTVDPAVAATHLDAIAAAGLPVWARVLRSGGVDVYEVGIGPWADRSVARERLARGDGDLVPEDPTWIDFGS